MTPTPSQALLLFGLLARHGECSQAELMPAVKKSDREALATAKLIAVAKVGRGLGLTLVDAGWAWTAAHLDAELPPAQRALSDLLGRLGEHFQRSGGTMADIIGAKPELEAGVASGPSAPAKAPARKTASSSGRRKASVGSARTTTSASVVSSKGQAARPTGPTPAAIRKRIEAAYLALTGGRKGEMVRLALLRAELADLDRTTMDAALGRILQGDKKASLMRNDDPRQLDPADHHAAFNPSGEPFHIIWIAS